MRTLTFAALALAASKVMATCPGTANFLSQAFWITLESTDQTYAADFKYCGLTVGDTLCCSKATVLTFQDKADAYIDTLEALAGDRDQYILDRRGDVLAVRDSLNSIVNTLTNGAKSDDATTKAAAVAAALIAGSFVDLATAVTTNFDTLKANFIKYQKARVTCIEKAVEYQASAWCLACGNDFGNQDGVTTGTSSVSYVAAVGTALNTACYDYISYSAGQSDIISLYITKDVLSSLATAVEKLVSKDATGAAEALATATTALTKVTLPTDANEKPSAIPASCTASSCSWLTDSVFNKGILQNQTIITGGSIGTVPTLASVSSRRLEGEIEGGRNLVDWTPKASGLTITFSDNPGKVDNDQNSAVRDGVVACAIAALAMVL